MWIEDLLKSILPPEIKHVLMYIPRKLRLTPMGKVLNELEKKGIKLKNLKALEVYGRCGDWHTIDYAPLVSSLEVWEVNPQYEKALSKNLPRAKVKITDSYKQIKKTKDKYNLIVVDNPESIHGNHCEHFDLFSDIFRISMNPTILILNVIPKIKGYSLKKYPELFNKKQLACRKSFYKTNHPENISFRKMIEVYKKFITTNGYILNWWQFFHKRSFVYYLVLKIERVEMYYNDVL